MKKQTLATLLIVTISLTICAQEGWYSQTSGTNSLLMDVYFTDQQTGWAVGNTNTILHTSDGGENWAPQNPPPSVNYSSVHFIDSQVGIAIGSSVGGDGKIRRTTDGGENWEEITAPGAYYLWEVYFSGSNKGWIVGGRFEGTTYDPSRTIHYSNDGGITWTTQLYQNDSLPLSGIHFYNENIGCAVGEGGRILWTNNGGADWISKNSGTNYQLWGIYLLNESTAWAVGVAGTIIYTTNSGETWTAYNAGLSGGYSEVIFTDNNQGWIVGGDAGSSTILYTSDAGSTWVEQTSGADHTLMGVSFVDTYFGWTVGNIGTILHTDDGGGVVSIDENEIDNNSFKLSINPNPFTFNTTFIYTLPETSHVSLEVYNVSGELFLTLVNDIQIPGKKTIEIDGTGLISGIYFCLLKTSEGIQSKKIIKL